MKSWSLSPSLHEGLRTETQGFLGTLGKQWWNAGSGHESEQILQDSEGQSILHAAVHRGSRVTDDLATEQQ